MAIIESLGIEVKIMIGGQPVPEHADNDPDPDDENGNIGPQTKTHHCYIECRENEEFAILMKILDGGPAAKWVNKEANVIRFAPSFNGADSVQGLTIYSKKDEGELQYGISNWNTDTTQRFKFAAVSTRDIGNEDSFTINKGLAQKLGLLYISVYRQTELKKKKKKKEKLKTKTKKQQPPLFRTPKTSGLDRANLEFSEQSLKGRTLSLGTTLSTPVAGISYRFCRAEDFVGKDQVDNSYATFVFKYRTREDLIQSMIIPRPRTPTPAPVEDEGSHLAAGTPRQPTVPAEPIPDSFQGAPVTQSPQSPPEPVTDVVESLPHEEVLRLAGERIKGLPFRKVLALAGAELKGLPFKELLRLATEKLEDVPFEEVLQLAGEKLAQLKDQNEQPTAIKREGGVVEHPERSSQQPVAIKREGQDMPSSERASKSRRVQGGKVTVDLTDDD